MDITVLANKTRLRLLLCLEKPHSVTELLTKCTLSQSALSQHLAKLKHAGAVTCTRSGSQQMYQVLNKKILAVARDILTLSK